MFHVSHIGRRTAAKAMPVASAVRASKAVLASVLLGILAGLASLPVGAQALRSSHANASVF